MSDGRNQMMRPKIKIMAAARKYLRRIFLLVSTFSDRDFTYNTSGNFYIK